MKNKPFLFLALLITLPLALIGRAAPQAAGQESQRFTVLRTGRVTGPSLAMTGAEANCVISGNGDEAAMRCRPTGVTASRSYHYNLALLVDAQGRAYVVACRTALVTNFWCKSLNSQRVVRGTLGKDVLAITDSAGEKPHDYLVLATRNIGPLTTPAAPAAPATNRRAAAAANPPAASVTVPANEGLAGCAAATGACVSFVSDPQGADIIVDGKFVGNTPSTLTLAPGSHQIRMEQAQRQPWTRTFEATTGGRITLRGVLEPQPK